jgi:Ca2+-binding RTX toxin-like protein
MADRAPTVDVKDQILQLGRTRLATQMFKASDPDGDAIERYKVIDNGLSAFSGYFSLAGKRVKAGTWLTIYASQLHELQYIGGSRVGWESLQVLVYANGKWSERALFDAYSVTPNDDKPEIRLRSTTVVESEKFDVTEIFSASDPDGFPILRYRFRDNNSLPYSGYFLLNGVKQEQGKWFLVDAADLEDLQFVAARGKNIDEIEASAFDGKWWADAESARVRSLENVYAPDIRAKYFTVTAEEALAGKSLFSFNDKDDNTLKVYRFRDASSNAQTGHFVFRGREQAAKQWITVKSNELTKLAYVSGVRNTVEYLQGQVFDGKHWSDIDITNINVRVRPDVIVDDFVVLDENEVFDIEDAMGSITGPPATAFEVYHKSQGSGSGALAFGISRLQKDTIHALSAFQFSQLDFIGGTGSDRWLDDVYLRANNGEDWGDWKKITFRTEPYVLDALLQDPSLYLQFFDPTATDNSWIHYKPVNDSYPGETLELTYSFMNRGPVHYDPGDAQRAFFVAFNNAQRANTRAILEELASVLGNVTFTEVSDAANGPYGGDLRFGYYAYGGGWTQPFGPNYKDYIPGADEPFVNPETGEVWLTSDTLNPFIFSDAEINLSEGLPRFALLKGIGYAMGLKNSFDGGVDVLPPPTSDTTFSVMAGNYFAPGDIAAHFSQQTGHEMQNFFSMYDYEALKAMYGLSDTYENGDNLYKYTAEFDYSRPFEPRRGQYVYETIFDTGGVDTIDFSNQKVSSVIDLRPGGVSSVGQYYDVFFDVVLRNADNFNIQLDTIIENAKGGRSNEQLIGNNVANRLFGNNGNDRFEGGLGDDYLFGGRGNDTYVYGLAEGFDRVNEAGSGGSDTLVIRSHWDLNKFSEDLTFKRLGNSLNIELTINGGRSQGRVLVINQGTSSSRVETLRLADLNGNFVTGKIDLGSIFTNGSNQSQSFRLTSNSTSSGVVAVPIV